VGERGNDPLVVLGDRLGELDEARDPAATRPLQPRVEERDRRLRVGLLEDDPELLLEQVRPVEALVDAGDRRQLRSLPLGQPFRPLPERPAAALQPAGAGEIA
jgi:hypothetical protein